MQYGEVVKTPGSQSGNPGFVSHGIYQPTKAQQKFIHHGGDRQWVTTLLQISNVNPCGRTVACGTKLRKIAKEANIAATFFYPRITKLCRNIQADIV